MRYLRWLSVALALFIAPRMASAQQKPAEKAPAKASETAPAGYAGSAACLDCHKETSQRFAATTMGKLIKDNGPTEHGTQGCESCHGPSKAHVESGGDVLPPISFSRKAKTSVAVRNATCLNCHEKTARTMWAGSTHESRNVACTDCHVVMHDNTETANLKKSSVLATCGSCHRDKAASMAKFAHMPLGEGKMECTSCHSPHGSPNEKLLIGTGVNETCFSCHAEKRGPFMWEHVPVTESCANCHDPHGSNKQRMLKTALPRLCQQCHFTPHGAPSARPSDQASVRFNYNKGCVNCHSAIHGSNHPAGAFFTR